MIYLVMADADEQTSVIEAWIDKSSAEARAGELDADSIFASYYVYPVELQGCLTCIPDQSAR
jgi:hypothetical protein